VRDEIMASNDYLKKLTQVLEHARSYVEGLDDRAVFPEDDAGLSGNA